jgi:hypothetical protein
VVAGRGARRETLSAAADAIRLVTPMIATAAA